MPREEVWTLSLWEALSDFTCRSNVVDYAFWGTSLAIQWLGLHVVIANGLDSIPSQGTKTHKPCSMAKKKKKNSMHFE